MNWFVLFTSSRVRGSAKARSKSSVTMASACCQESLPAAEPSCDGLREMPRSAGCSRRRNGVFLRQPWSCRTDRAGRPQHRHIRPRRRPLGNRMHSMPGWAAATSASSMGLSSTNTTLSASIFHACKIRATEPILRSSALPRENAIRRQQHVRPLERPARSRRIVPAGNADQHSLLGKRGQQFLIQPVQMMVVGQVPTHVFRPDFPHHSVPQTTVVIGAASPAMLTLGPAGTGQCAAINLDGTLNSAQTPAPAGSIVSLFLIGTGASGQPDGALPPRRPTFCRRRWLWWATQLAQVLYAGPSPGSTAALTQINIRLPSVASGRLPVFVLANGFGSQFGATLSVKWRGPAVLAQARGRPPGRPARTHEEPDQGGPVRTGRPPHLLGGTDDRRLSSVVFAKRFVSAGRVSLAQGHRRFPAPGFRPVGVPGRNGGPIPPVPARAANRSKRSACRR